MKQYIKTAVLFILLISLCTTALYANPTEGLGNISVHETLKQKFIEGNPLFMSFVALTFIIGLTICIERIIYLSLANINTKKFVNKIDTLVADGKEQEAIQHCMNTRGPVASICLQGLLHAHENIDRKQSLEACANVEIGKLEKGCSWITLFISLAPSLGFLGTVIGMVISFDNIEMAGDISPTIVAGGMRVALITTIFGIIVAVVLQLFYNYILSQIENLTTQMEQASIDMQEILLQTKH